MENATYKQWEKIYTSRTSESPAGTFKTIEQEMLEPIGLMINSSSHIGYGFIRYFLAGYQPLVAVTLSYIDRSMQHEPGRVELSVKHFFETDKKFPELERIIRRFELKERKSD